MPIQYKIRRGSTSEANSITLTEGEIYMDLGDKSLRVHDGATQGGTALAKKSDLPNQTLNTTDNPTFSSIAIDYLTLHGGLGQSGQIAYSQGSSGVYWGNLKTVNDQSLIGTGNISLFSGSYNDLTNKPSIPYVTSQLMNDAGFVGVSGGSVTGLLTTQKTDEVINTKTNATGVVTHDFTSGSIWYHSNISANFTPNFTNVPTTDNRSIVNTLVLSQGATPYIPTALQINGVAQTIKWLGSTVPTAEAQTVNIVSFVMIRTNNTWTVLGSLSLYG